MNYRSAADLASAVRLNLWRVPADVDLVVGVPRSGMLAATLIALNLNLNCCSVDEFVAGAELRHGRTRTTRHPGLAHTRDARHVLVVDDSIHSGGSMAAVRERLASIGAVPRLTFAAVYATREGTLQVDLALEVLPAPRWFEWNVLHRDELRDVCLDIDGVLCVDPTPAQNDDGPAYQAFLDAAPALALPSKPVGHLVTSRLEKYRPQTLTWLQRHGVQFGQLHMLDLPDAATRRRLGCHARFKAEIYRRQLRTRLFIESETEQARQIAALAGKPVLAFGTQTVFEPPLGVARAQAGSFDLLRRTAARAREAGRRLVGRG